MIGSEPSVRSLIKREPGRVLMSSGGCVATPCDPASFPTPSSTSTSSLGLQLGVKSPSNRTVAVFEVFATPEASHAWVGLSLGCQIHESREAAMRGARGAGANAPSLH